MKIISCSSNIPLAEKIAEKLNTPLVKTTIKRFADNEFFLQINENMQGRTVFVIQSASQPANDTLMELLITIDALKRSIAKRIIAVIPYYGYSRQDRKTATGTPVSAKLVANLIATAGADRIICLDWHTEQMQGFFDIPAYDLQVIPLFAKSIQERYAKTDSIIVSPDIGGVLRARKLADILNKDIAIVEKRRDFEENLSILNIIGSVKEKNCLILDDIVDSGKTLRCAAAALHDAGAKTIDAYITHGVLSQNALDNIKNSHINRLIITDSICPTKQILECPKIEILSISDLLAQAIRSMTH